MIKHIQENKINWYEPQSKLWTLFRGKLRGISPKRKLNKVKRTAINPGNIKLLLYQN
jgi:hypothetical protein